ncbi:56kDa selenium binding protein [Lasiosphaeria hispida]|uniref:56kDa selenium binding protein n=1 Tax=Lasiosphaeria hispida TaxID=260671 RepID=A0AAJ0HK85_9PEZI|nr:56kDa selenium binding protein [Lasiosphaeria hispida]
MHTFVGFALLGHLVAHLAGASPVGAGKRDGTGLPVPLNLAPVVDVVSSIIDPLLGSDPSAAIGPKGPAGHKRSPLELPKLPDLGLPLGGGKGVGKRSPLDLSIPPIIPLIPGVTEPLSENAPPLPILQVPTPPLESEPEPFAHHPNLKPKKIGYFWTGAGDNHHKDFLATTSLDDDTFGTIIDITDVPSSGNSPHHLGTTLDGQLLVGGGLLSLLKTQDTAYYFDVSDPYKPKFAHSNRGVLSSIVDEIRAKPDGGFFITYMGSAAGTSPGRLVETDPLGNIVHEWPEDVESTLNILGEQFSPHGLSIDFEANVALTSDFVVPYTILKPTTGIERANTLRLWNIETRTIISTITIPDGQGIQDVKFIPGNKESAALATAVGLGQVWIIYPFRFDKSGKQGVAELLYDLGHEARDSMAIYSDISDDGKLAYFTITLANHVAALDISDLNNVKRLDDPAEEQPIIGPHYVKISPDKKNLLVLGYFVQAGDISVLNTPADFKAHWLDINNDGSISFNRTIDFENIFTRTRGGARPHSVVIFDLTNPDDPKYY